MELMIDMELGGLGAMMDSFRYNRDLLRHKKREPFSKENNYLSVRKHKGIVDGPVDESVLLMVRASTIREAKRERSKRRIILVVSVFLAGATMIFLYNFLNRIV